MIDVRKGHPEKPESAKKPTKIKIRVNTEEESLIPMSQIGLVINHNK